MNYENMLLKADAFKKKFKIKVIGKTIFKRTFTNLFYTVRNCDVGKFITFRKYTFTILRYTIGNCDICK